jgi:hypothetical protein
MQCRNCQFENMPGVDACGRCGASLRLATAVIDVHPPRAGRWSKRFGRLFPRGVTYRVRDAVTDALPVRPAIPSEYFPEWSVLLRMVVPGWPQLYMGRKGAGRAILFCYALLLLSGVTFIGTISGSILLGLAITCHASSIIDIVTSATVELRTRAIMCAGCIAVVGLVTYVPAGRLVSLVVVPRVIQRNVPPFASGDVVLYTPAGNTWRGLRRGDVVIYEQLPLTVAQPAQHREFRIQGERIDRILAIGGQTAVWDGLHLVVDGISSNLVPLDPAGCHFRLETTVPAGHFLILPSSIDVVAMGAIDHAQLQTLCLVRQENVVGRVFLRQQPLSRFWWVR